jgi:hypothetical protein
MERGEIAAEEHGVSTSLTKGGSEEDPKDAWSRISFFAVVDVVVKDENCQEAETGLGRKTRGVGATAVAVAAAATAVVQLETWEGR